MIVVHDDRHVEHNPGIVDFPEQPYRIQSILTELRKLKGVTFQSSSKPADNSIATQVHSKEYLHFLSSLNHLLPDDRYHLPIDFNGEQDAELMQLREFSSDISAPVSKHTYHDAMRSAQVAYTGAQHLKKDRVVYSLCRPPGHHAMKHSMGGFCYINNTAVAAQQLSAQGKVAILDIDFHHGNGTQDIFYDRNDVLYVSIHEDPTNQYPYRWGFADETGDGKGKGFNMNIPLPPGTDDEEYDRNLIQALHQITEYKPTHLIVSVGYDTYEHDLLGDFKLTTKYYQKIGEHIDTLHLPTLLIQEGGYHEEIGHNAASFVSGFSTAPMPETRKS